MPAFILPTMLHFFLFWHLLVNVLKRCLLRLADGTQVKFRKDSSWKKIDCHRMKAVPAATVPAAIKSYVQAHFPGCVVSKIDKERYGYDIELSNDLELKFNHQGAIIGYDD